MVNDTKKLYTVAEVCKLLGVGKAKVYKLIKDGYLPALNLGGLKVRRETLDSFLSEYDGYDLSDTNNIVKIIS